MSMWILITIQRLTLSTESPFPIKDGPTTTFAPSGLNIALFPKLKKRISLDN